MQSRCRTWSHNGSSRIRAKQKLHRKHRSLQKFLESERKPNVIYTDRFFKFGKACQDLSWNHCTSPPHRSETNGIAERAVRRVKEGTSAVLWQVRTKIGGQIPRNVAPVCETAQISYLMGRRTMKDVLVNLLKDRLFHFLTGWVLPKNCEGPVTNPSILKESLTWIVPRIRNVREENLDGWRAGCRPWEVGDDGRIGNLLEKTQCERGDISQTRRIIFPIADGRIKPFGGDQDLRTSTSTRQPPIQGESHVDFLGKSEGSLPPPHDSFPDASEAINDSWSMSGNFRNRLHVEPRVKIHSPREELFPIPMKYIDVSWSTHANLDVNQEKPIDDYWNIDGSRDLSDPWTGFTQCTILEEKPPEGYLLSGRRLTRKQPTFRPNHLWAGFWEKMWKNAKLKEKQKWSYEKLHLDNAWQLRGICLNWPWGQGISENHEECSQEIGNTNCSRFALQKYEEQ